MFNREIKIEKTLSIIYLFLAFPFITFAIHSFRYQDYYYDYTSPFSTVTADGMLAIATLFLSLLVKERYLQYIFQFVGTIKLLTLLLRQLFQNTSFTVSSMLALLCGAAAIGFSVKVFTDQKINPTLFFKAFFGRLKTTPHVIFGRVFVGLAVLSALGSFLVAFFNYSDDRLTAAVIYKLINGIASAIISLLISEVLYFLISKNWDELASIKEALDDTRINTYITRTLSSWTYLIFRQSFLVAAAVAVPWTMGGIGNEWLPFIGGFVLLPLYIIFAYLVLMIIRLFFEYSNALIHIVQNTSK